MSEQSKVNAPGQQNFPSEENPKGNPDALSGEEIKKGANQQDQLEGLKENTSGGNANNRSGASPTAYQYERKLEGDQ